VARVSSRAVTSPYSVAPTVRSTEETWAATTVAQLSHLPESDRKLVRAHLKAAGARSGQDWAVQFAGRVGGFVLLSAILFASAIGAVAWSGRVSSERSAAAITAASYLVIALVALPGLLRRGYWISDHFNRIRPDAFKRFLRYYIPVLAIMGLVYIIANTRAFNGKSAARTEASFYLAEFIAFATVTALGFVIAYLATVSLYAASLNAPASPKVLLWAAELTMTIVTGLLVTRRTRNVGGNIHLDSGMLRLLNCAVTMEDLAKEPVPAPAHVIKELILRLEIAARDLEVYAVRRVPRLDIATRRITAEDGTRLASIIRCRKASLALAITPCVYTEVASTITRVLLAWSRAESADLEAMVRSAPTVERASVARRLASRVWQALLLAAAGVVLPFLPIYTANPQAGADARYALITAAVVALATGSVPVWDTIEKSLQPAS